LTSCAAVHLPRSGRRASGQPTGRDRRACQPAARDAFLCVKQQWQRHTDPSRKYHRSSCGAAACWMSTSHVPSWKPRGEPATQTLRRVGSNWYLRAPWVMTLSLLTSRVAPARWTYRRSTSGASFRRAGRASQV